MEKLLTLIIPTYNMEKYLRVCLDSLIIGQNQGNLEVLVINDGSKDASLDIAHKYEEKHPETFRVIDKENGNYGSCINRGLKEATGRYVKVLDADDYFDNTALKALMQKIPTIDTDLILTDNTIFGNNNISKKYYGFNLPTNVDLDFASHCDKIKDCIQMHNVTYKKDIFNRFVYRQTEGISYTDMEWIFAPMARVKTFTYLALPLYKYLVGREGQTVSSEQMKRSISHRIKLTSSMLSMYNEIKADVDSAVNDYLYFRLLREVKNLYRSYLADVSGLCLDELSVFDKRLQTEQPELYIDSARFTMGPFIRIHYVDYWRKHNYAPQPNYFYILNSFYFKLLMWCKRLFRIHHL